MKIALAQIRPPEDPELALALCPALARGAAMQGAELLLLPELLLPGYNRPDRHAALAQAQDGPWMQAMAAVAREAGIALCWGWAERHDGRLWNAATVLDSAGRTLAHYRKIQLFGEMERSVFTPGTQAPPVFTLAGRRCGLLICYDIEFPEHARALARAGAEVLLVPTANPEGFDGVPGILVPARALENAMTVAYANYTGPDHGLVFGGGSVVAGPDGQALNRLGRAEGLAILTLPERGAYPAAQLSAQLEDLRVPVADPG
ncbi:carbon-nitrogen hydrolase family protein [Pseudooceanicola sp. CBS1P-1]|uniref:Nitrilase n=1 Tax=Pseudooceanicola albus TaxID=2692189 RepID=A0A6L7G083_9RHOB|nr:MULTISPECIES: carbon-nitrogen hydrolase family protein [Pseudooceanicola]MBT9382244.1 carbon-nitrogen hydrolase family protein [Pseudooceanicola endophyticus]MXN16787.1 nitrilase [Pseudooceanicola albus]